MWGKILAGVGVGAVAAAPFTGGGSLLGGASLIASLSGASALAAGAGAVGGAVGAAVANNEEEEKESIKKQAKAEGKAEGKAEASIEIDKLQENLSNALKKLKENDKLFSAIIAMEAVGVACAACDGHFSENEKEEIGEFVKGMMEQSIPEHVKEKIQKVYNNPPTLKEAFELAKKSGLALEEYEDLIKYVIEIDGATPEEEAFLHGWHQLRAA